MIDPALMTTSSYNYRIKLISNSITEIYMTSSLSADQVWRYLTIYPAEGSTALLLIKLS
jgi:hypothetical protein